MKTISIQDLAAKLKNVEENDLFIDVRTAEEFEKDHIPGVENKPLEDIEKWHEEVKGKVVYLSCLSGNRAAQAAKELIEKGEVSETIVCEGGPKEWKEVGKIVQFQTVVGNEMTKAKNSFVALSIKRQRLLIVGALLLFCLIFRDIGRLLILILALALLFSGFSGKSILEDLLKKMPWNKEKK